MPKKKAPTPKAKGPQNKNAKDIITIQRGEIKHTGRKFDSAFLEMKLWVPLWELPHWFSKQHWEDLYEQVKKHCTGGNDEA